MQCEDRKSGTGFVDPTGRDALAARLVDLYEQGYLSGDLPDSEQADPMARLQIAAGDITNYASLGDLLDRAEVEISELAAVDVEEREEALGLIALLRGKALDLGGGVLSGAGGGLLSGVIAQLPGLPRLS